MEKVVKEEPYFGDEKLEIGGIEISLDDLRPYFSVHIYQGDIGWETLEKNPVKTLEKVDWPDGVRFYFWQLESKTLLALVTVIQEEPSWAQGTGIQGIQFDLHLFYYREGEVDEQGIKHDNLLFEATTFDKIANYVHHTLVGERAKNVSSPKIMSLLNFGKNFYTVGLRNVTGRGPAQPDYKTLAGPQAQAAVLPTDRKTFMMGHALRWLSKEETRGVTTLHSKVWTNRRNTIEEFKNWCDRLARELEAKVIPGGPLGLAICEKIDKLSERPLAVYLDYSFMESEFTIEINKKRARVVPRIEIDSSTEEDGELSFFFCFDPCEDDLSSRDICMKSYKLQYIVGPAKFWRATNADDLRIEMIFPDGKRLRRRLETYLESYPPSLVMPSGGVVIGDEHWKPSRTPGSLPDGCLIPLEWEGCNRKKEFEDKKKKKEENTEESGEKRLCIQEWIAKELEDPHYIKRELISNDALIINDHGTGEIADIIVIEPVGENKRIEFYHCKAMKGDDPGTRVGEAYEVLGQACRNGQWILSPTLMEELCRRTQSPRESPLLRGDKTTLKVLSEEFRCNAWEYEIVAVQPGFNCSEIEKCGKVYPLFVATHEWLSACGARFAAWGSQTRSG